MTHTYTVYTATAYNPARPNITWCCDWLDWSTGRPVEYWARSGNQYDVRATGTDYDTAARIAGELAKKYGARRHVMILKLTGDNSGPLGSRKYLTV